MISGGFMEQQLVKQLIKQEFLKLMVIKHIKLMKLMVNKKQVS